MLLYHPVEDSNHCCYRLIRLLYSADEAYVSLINLFICDFYSLFPGRLKNIQRWPRAKSAAWRELRSIGDEYEEMLNPQRVFFQLNALQVAAISHLHSQGVIGFKTSSDHEVSLNIESLPAEFLKTLDEDGARSTAWFVLVAHELLKMEPLGANGLKSRTGLMEYVYD
jgi:hypothetical protein